MYQDITNTCLLSSTMGDGEKKNLPFNLFHISYNDHFYTKNTPSLLFPQGVE